MTTKTTPVIPALIAIANANNEPVSKGIFPIEYPPEPTEIPVSCKEFETQIVAIIERLDRLETSMNAAFTGVCNSISELDKSEAQQNTTLNQTSTKLEVYTEILNKVLVFLGTKYPADLDLGVHYWYSSYKTSKEKEEHIANAKQLLEQHGYYISTKVKSKAK